MNRSLASGLILASILTMAGSAPPPGRAVRAVGDRDRSEVAVFGLEPAALARLRKQPDSREAWESVCRLTYPLRGPIRSMGQGPAFRGTYRVEGDVLRFYSRFPLDEPGYSLLIAPSLLRREDRPTGSDRPLVLDVELVPNASATSGEPSVKSVFPSTPTPPANLLRLYIQFATPMSRGQAYDHIHLLDASGREMHDAFLELHEELWSVDGRRFTILFDPGRIKRGLRPREEMGPILEPNRSYALVIDGRWPDARGRPLGRDHRKDFRPVAEAHDPPDHRRWRITSPPAATRRPFEVDFGSPMDSALALRLLVLKGPDGRPVGGEAKLGRHERSWNFTPETPWAAGDYRLEIGLDLEDLAGNRIGQPFEVDLVSPITRADPSRTAVLSIRIAPPSGR